MLQKKKLIILLFALIVVISATWKDEGDSEKMFKAYRRFVFKNQCPQTIWIGAFGVPLPPSTGWEMPSNTQQ